MAFGPESNFVVLIASPASLAQPAPSSTNSALAPMTGTYPIRMVSGRGCALSLVAVAVPSASAPKPWIRLRRDGMPAPSKARMTTGEMTRKATDWSSAQGDVACESWGQPWVKIGRSETSLTVRSPIQSGPPAWGIRAVFLLNPLFYLLRPRRGYPVPLSGINHLRSQLLRE